MPEPHLIPRPSFSSSIEFEESLPSVIWRCPEGSSLILETPNRRQAWSVIDGQWKCLGDIHKEKIL